jgi:hypothetical protein
MNLPMTAQMMLGVWLLDDRQQFQSDKLSDYRSVFEPSKSKLKFPSNESVLKYASPNGESWILVTAKAKNASLHSKCRSIVITVQRPIKLTD